MAAVLIVDDQDMVRRTLRSALESEGFVVSEAADGEQALQVYSRAPTDVVVIDIVMPNKEGIETIFELRRSSSAVKIIAMSGRDTAEFLEMAKKLGADHVLRKPFGMRVLADLVRRCLEQNSSAA